MSFLAKRLFDDGSVVILEKNGRYYIRHDVGTHQITMRKDEITEQELKYALAGEKEMTNLLFEIQQHLESSGVDPYASNTK